MIKWFDSRLMSGIPEITNTQGDLVKMLNGLLVNGANSKPVAAVSYADGVCTLEVGVNHGFALHSVISIKGSTQVALNDKDFRIKAITVSTISFKVTTTVNSEVGITVGYAPLGWTQYFASEGKSCYKSPDPRYPAYLRVDDTRYANQSATAAKWAGVEICANMSDFDTADWQSPYDPAIPNKNRAYVSAAYYGWFRWFYASAVSNTPNGDVSPNGKRDFVLIGDETGFYLILYPFLGDATCAVVGMPLADYGIEKKQVLLANQPTNTSQYSYATYDFLTKDKVLDVALVEECVAPFYGDLSSGVRPYIISGLYLKDMVVQTPIMLKRGVMVDAVVNGMASLPLSMDTAGVIKADKNIFKPLNTGNGSYVVFDLGEY
ncbi:hypothetical protein ACS8FA_07350 [Psychrobacter sp. 1Y1]|uniref:hypothetical protein n=1 Tax=Psychrobacter sp. 1Y1 TaxID=3453574 RepID=UPI003F46D69C